MSRRLLLICNDEPAARQAGHACRLRGLGAPLWCAVLPGCGSVVARDADALIVVADREIEWLIADAARSAPVIVVGQSGQDLGGRVRVVDPSEGWPERMAGVLVDALGLLPVLLPSYENRLRVIGRELDRQGCIAASIAELDDRLHVEPEPVGGKPLPAFDVSNREFGTLVRESITSRGEGDWERPRGRVAVGGHERLLRYLGYELDRRGAGRVQISVLARSLVVSGYQSPSPYDEPEAFQEMYRPSHLETMLQEADRKRQESERWIDRISRRLGIR